MVITKTISLRSKGNTDIIDITGKVSACLGESGLSDGIVTLFVPGSTGALSTVEFEPGAVRDLKEAYQNLAPVDGDYAHNTKWGDGNGFSHVRAALTGPSLSVPFAAGRLMLGTWQQVIFMDFDNRPRSREIIAQFMGEK